MEELGAAVVIVRVDLNQSTNELGGNRDRQTVAGWLTSVRPRLAAVAVDVADRAAAAVHFARVLAAQRLHVEEGGVDADGPPRLHVLAVEVPFCKRISFSLTLTAPPLCAYFGNCPCLPRGRRTCSPPPPWWRRRQAGWSWPRPTRPWRRLGG